MADNATAAGERYGRGWHPTTAAGVAPQLGEAFDQSHRPHHLVGAVLFLGGANQESIARRPELSDAMESICVDCAHEGNKI
jgi:hypothetical protein